MIRQPTKPREEVRYRKAEDIVENMKNMQPQRNTEEKQSVQFLLRFFIITLKHQLMHAILGIFFSVVELILNIKLNKL